MIKVENINKYYSYKKTNEYHALKNVSLEVEEGEMLAIMGASGSGKSTLLHLLGGIDDFQSGEIIVDGEKLSEMNHLQRAKYRNQKVGIVLQDLAILEDVSVMDNVQIPMIIARRRNRKQRFEYAIDALKKVGLDEIANKNASNLSGGQRQRIAIARAIINSPDYILADEPTGSLDSENGHQVIELFKKLNKEGKTIIIVTHDANIAKECDRTVVISDGRMDHH